MVNEGRSFLRFFSRTLLIAFAIVFALPLVSWLLMSFRANEDILTNGILRLPAKVSFEGFVKAWTYNKIGVYLRNSVIVTVPSVLGSLLLGSLAAYAFMRFRFRFKNFIIMLLFAGLWFPAQTFLVPVYLLLQRIRLYDTFYGLIVAHIAYSLPFATFVLTKFFQSIEQGVVEAAVIDGAGELRIMWRIIMPMAKSAIMSVGIFQFAWIWNDLFWSLTITQSPKIQPVMIGITSTVGRFVFDWNGEAAGALVAAIGPLLVFVFMQRYFLEGIRMGYSK
jgi:multiple sugar transport system permease protein